MIVIYVPLPMKRSNSTQNLKAAVGDMIDETLDLDY